MAYTARQAQLVTAAYQQYLHRTPSSAEIQAQVDEAARRGETESQWQARIDAHFRGTAPAPTVAPATVSTAGPTPGPVPSAKIAPPAAGYAHPWDPVVADIKAQNPGLSEGEIWRRYTVGQYTPQPHYPDNPYKPVPYVPLTKTGMPDYSVFKPPPTGGPAEARAEVDPVQRAREEQVRVQAMGMAKIIPGASPEYGVLPDGTVISFLNMQPLGQGPNQSKHADAVTQAFAKLALQNPGVPVWADVKGSVTIPGRGFQFKGDPSPEEQALAARFLAGETAAAGPLAQSRMKRLQVSPRSMNPLAEKILRQFILSGIAVGFGAMTGGAATALIGGGAGAAGGAGLGAAGFTGAPLGAGGVGLGLGSTAGTVGGGAVGGAAASTVGQGIGTGQIDWRKVLTAGASGGVGAGAGQALSGLGSIGAGAGAGAASAGTNVALTKALGGQVDPWDVLEQAVVGGVSRGIQGAGTALTTQTGTDPQGIGEFVIPPSQAESLLVRLMSSLGAQGTKQFLTQLGIDTAQTGFPATETPQTTAFPKEVMDRLKAAAAQAREREMTAAMADFREKLAAFEAKKAEAMAAAQGQAEGKLAEFRTKQAAYNQQVAAAGAARDAAREKLREQYAAYLERARASRTAPLPPIPVPAGRTTPLPVLAGVTRAASPFDPSAASSGQTFAGDFPTSRAPTGVGTADFPISQTSAPGPAAATTAPTRTTKKQLPLTILQIQAALASRRRT